MRIIAGAFRGRRLHAPRGETTRPTGDRVREAVFSIIAARVPEAMVLDLFAGTGAMGLEALSRGGARAVFVEQTIGAVRLIRKNIELCGAGDSAEVIHDTVRSAVRRLAAGDERFDLIFMDPPYGKGLVGKTLETLDVVAASDALVVAEHFVRDETPELLKSWSKTTERRYGDTLISIYACA